ncbi:DUF4229 domain-containing protein [Cellulomonas citrea]|uniref:DUF4229 domain-containing protein n=1 Tax=Cellulomonas citrea TaxID=1909423 RepID=UPI0013575D1A|nr:DUF4229 domain-containing protein [Cellulomonas citrea]
MAVIRYSVLRLGLFVVALVALLWAGMNPWLSPLLAAFVAWGLSYVLLAGPRDAAALQVAERAEARRARQGRTELTGRAREDADAEDAADEAARAAAADGTAPSGDDEALPTADGG